MYTNKMHIDRFVTTKCIHLFNGQYHNVNMFTLNVCTPLPTINLIRNIKYNFLYISDVNG